MKSLICICLFLTFYLSSIAQPFSVIPVPYVSSDPTIPHPTYNGNKTLLKAVVRSANLTDEFYYRWDADGDGAWDNVGSSMVEPTGKWYRANGHMLEGWFTYPDPPEGSFERKIYNATLQVCSSLSGSDPVDPQWATYRVIYYPGFPPIENISEVNDEQLELIRAVSLDNVLWYMHKQLYSTRSGVGTVGITAYLESYDTFHRTGNTALFAIALLYSGHQPAYPNGTYHVYNNDPPEGFTDKNDFLYNTDPYSEDLIRLLNYILNNVGQMTIDATSENDDGTEPIAGTNDLTGYFVYTNSNGEANPHSFAITALASSGLLGTEVQVNDLLKGKSWEFLTQQLVDYIQFIQKKTGPDTGGWHYSQTGTSISYLTGGWVCALEQIEGQCSANGVYINNACKTNLVNAIKRYQNSDGGALYEYGNGLGSLFEATAMTFNACTWLGWNNFASDDTEPIGPAGLQITKGEAKTIYTAYYNYLTTNWTRSGGTGIIDPDRALWNDGNVDIVPPVTNLWNYSMLFTALAASPKELSEINSYGTHDWRREFILSIARNQYDESSPGQAIPEAGYSLVSAKYLTVGSSAMAASTLNIMSESYGPVSVPAASALEVMEGCAGGMAGKVEFFHDDSYCTDPSQNLADYQWIFDSEGGGESEFNNIYINGTPVSWADIPLNTFIDGKWHTNISNNPPLYTYMNSGEYTAALRVLNDNPGIPETDIAYISINVLESPNFAPVASSGGPYTILEGEDLTLEGVATDANEACGDILSSSWDLDDDGVYGDFTAASGTVTWSVLESLGLETNVAHDISLRTIDEKGESSISATTLTISIATDADEITSGGKTILHPNPVHNILTITTDLSIKDDIRISITDNKGKLVIVKKLQHDASDISLDVSTLSAGIYYVQIRSAGLIKQLSFIKI